MAGLEEAGARFEAAPRAEASRTEAGPEPPVGRLARIGRLLARLGPLLDRTRTLLLSSALLLLLLLVGWSIWREAREEAILVERIAVPRSLGERGLEGEVLASRLVDAIAEASAAAYWRGERPTVAAGWRTSDFRIPGLEFSVGTLVRMVEDLLGRPDRRVSGELVVLDGRESLRLRISPPRPGAAPIVRPVLDPASEAAVDRALQAAALDLLARLDPVALAARLLVLRFERGEPDPRALLGDPERAPLDSVRDAVNACLVDPRCPAGERARAYGIWGEALRRAAARVAAAEPGAREALLEEALEKLEIAGGAGGPLEVRLRRADVLLALGREAEAFRAFAEAAAAFPDAPGPLRDWARALARSDRPGDAVAPLEAAARLAPRDAWIRFELASARLAAGEARAAIGDFRAALRLDSRLHCALAGSARALAALGEEAESRRRRAEEERLRGDQPPCRWPDA